jgi:hypothetical protein
VARILGHSKVRRELAKLASRNARSYTALIASDESERERERLELAYRRGFLDGVDIADKINSERSQS